jgi:hypothetical protein
MNAQFLTMSATFVCVALPRRIGKSFGRFGRTYCPHNLSGSSISNSDFNVNIISSGNNISKVAARV